MRHGTQRRWQKGLFAAIGTIGSFPPDPAFNGVVSNDAFETTIGFIRLFDRG